jgi:predicted AlkP superfamily phosphohydrolase/phosphomutase
VYSESQSGRRKPVQRRFEIGSGKWKAIIFTTVLVLGIYSAVKIVPAYVSNYQLADKMQEVARFGVVNRDTEEQIRDKVFKVVQDLEIPAKREDIKVFSSNSLVKISMDYTVPVDLLVYHLDLHFTPASENKSLL